MTKWITDPRNKAVADLSDSLSNDAPQSPWAKWFGGMVVPLLIAIVGISNCISKQAVFSGDGADLNLHGKNAIAMGIALLSVSAFLHTHYFWGNLERMRQYSDFGKTISAIAFIGSFGYVCWSIIMS